MTDTCVDVIMIYISSMNQEDCASYSEFHSLSDDMIVGELDAVALYFPPANWRL